MSEPSDVAQPSGIAAQPVLDCSKAPLPTAATLARRSSVTRQLPRFAVFNARIMRMVFKGHH